MATEQIVIIAQPGIDVSLSLRAVRMSYPNAVVLVTTAENAHRDMQELGFSIPERMPPMPIKPLPDLPVVQLKNIAKEINKGAQQGVKYH